MNKSLKETFQERSVPIQIMDIVSIFFITYYHAFNYHQITHPTNDPINQILNPYLVTFGLAAFTFSSGFKFSLKNSENIKKNDSLLKIVKKRFIRLYRPYLSYSLLIYCLLIVVQKIWPEALKYPFLYLPRINSETLIKFFFFGINPIAGHLWYLFILLVINIISLLMIGTFGIGFLLYFIFPVLLLYFSINIHILKSISIVSEIPFYILIYMTIFLFGFLFAHLERTLKPILIKRIPRSSAAGLLFL